MIPRVVTSEAELIQGFLAPLAAGYPGAFALKDDAATITPPAGTDLVVTMDAIAAGVHFFADDAAADIGWKALAVNISDLVAKGTKPHAYLMSLAFPEPPSAEWLAGFVSGLGQAQAAFGLHLIGGDTDRRPGPLAITVTAAGLVPTGRMVRRGTACAGDRVLVSGTLGDSALGLVLRRPGDKPCWKLDQSHRDYLAGRYLRPAPRLALAPIVRQLATAAMDISDGLMKDLMRMAAASGVGARVDVSHLPLSEAVRVVLAQDSAVITTIATGGDDYEVLAAVSPREAAAFIAAAKAAGVPVTDIGCFEPGSGAVLLDARGRIIDLARTGYDHI